MIMKNFKEAVSIIVRDIDDKFLIVKRPNDPNDDLAGVWGFPAVTLRPDEKDTDGIDRIARTKLGMNVGILKRLGESTHERPGYTLKLVDYEVLALNNSKPKVPQPYTDVTQYTECKFTNDPSILIPAAQKGSQCTQIFLESLKIDWKTSA